MNEKLKTSKPHIWQYALKLEDGKFYIGITSRRDPFKRIEQHMGGNGAKWTKLHAPMWVLEMHDLDDMNWEEAYEEEQNRTIEYADKHGIDNVRGGQTTYTGKVYSLFGKYYPDWLLKNIVMVLVMMTAIAYLAINLLLQ